MSSTSALIPENYDALKDAYVEASEEVESLRRQVEFYRKHFFGTKSERSHLSPSGQISLLEATENAATPVSGETVVVSHGRKRRSRKEAESGLPLVTIVHDLPEEKKRCACGKAMEATSQERTVVR